MTDIVPMYTMVRDLPSSLETHVALVVIDDEMFVMKRPRTMFGVTQIARELKLMKALDGMQGIPQLKMHFVEERRMTLIYEYCPNGDLMDYLMSPANTLDAKIVARSLLQILERLHSKGIAHLDIKPENVVFDSDFQALVIDFGLATTDARSNLKCGTKRYSAPEVLSGRGYIPAKADIWSLGVLLIVFHYRTTPFDNGVLEYFDFPTFWTELDVNFAHSTIDVKAKEFIEFAMQPEITRPTASELLLHSWLN